MLKQVIKMILKSKLIKTIKSKLIKTIRSKLIKTIKSKLIVTALVITFILSLVSCNKTLPQVVYKNIYIPQKCNISIPQRQKCLISNALNPSEIFKCMQYDKLYSDELLKDLKFCVGK